MALIREDAAETSMSIAVLLAMVGGYLNAFTYVAHGRVFATAMSGNVVLIGVSAASGDWSQALRQVLPVIASLIGVGVAQLPRSLRTPDSIPGPAVAALLAEMAFLFGAGWLPENVPDQPLVLGIAFLGAWQSSTFPRVEQWSYSSTVTTTNLRQFADAGFQALFGGPRPEATRRARVFGITCLMTTPPQESDRTGRSRGIAPTSARPGGGCFLPGVSLKP